MLKSLVSRALETFVSGHEAALRLHKSVRDVKRDVTKIDEILSCLKVGRRDFVQLSLMKTGRIQCERSLHILDDTDKRREIRDKNVRGVLTLLSHVPFLR